MSVTAVETKKGLTLRMLIFTIILTVLAFIFNWWLETLTTWWLYPGFLPFPWIIWIVLSHLVLAKISLRFKLTVQELAILTGVSYLIGGWTWLPGGFTRWNVAGIPTFYQFWPIHLMTSAAHAERFGPWVPSYWVPKEPALYNAIWYGIPKTQSINWGAWTMPMLWAMAWFLLGAISSLFWGFMLRKPWVEVERLTFAPSVPPVNAILWATPTEEKGKARLFDLKSRIGKLFWGGFVIGLLLTIPDIRSYVVPGIPPSAEWGYNLIDLTIINRILPGAYGSYIFSIPEAIIWYIIPMDITLTAVIAQAIVFFVYEPVGVALGWMPYVPASATSHTPYGMQYGPFQFIYFVRWGIVPGIAVWTIWTHRKHFINIFRVAFGASKGLPLEEDGVPYRLIGLGAITLSLLFIAFLTVNGIPLGVAIIFFLLWLMGMISQAKVVGETGMYEIVNSAWTPPLLWDAGAAIGAWPATAPHLSEATFKTFWMNSVQGSGGPRYVGNLPYVINIWKVAYETKTRAKDMFIATFITFVVAAIVAGPVSIWWMHYLGGFAKLGPITYYTGARGAATTFTTTVPGDLLWTDAVKRWVFVVAGIALTFGIQIARARFPWFYLNVVGLVPAWRSDGFLLHRTVALVAKFLTLRVGGARLYSETALPLAIGAIAGYGVMYFITQLGWFIAVGIPNFQAALGAP